MLLTCRPHAADVRLISQLLRRSIAADALIRPLGAGQCSGSGPTSVDVGGSGVLLTNFRRSVPHSFANSAVFGEFVSFWSIVGRFSANSANSMAISTPCRRTWPVLARFRPFFCELGHFCADFNHFSVRLAVSGVLPTIYWRPVPTVSAEASSFLTTQNRRPWARLKLPRGQFLSAESRGARVQIRPRWKPHIRLRLYVVSRPVPRDRPSAGVSSTDVCTDM